MTENGRFKLHGDRWRGTEDRAWSIEQPSAADLDRALEQLDAKTYTLITLEAQGDEHLCVGGGAGRYVAYAKRDNDEFWNPVGDAAEDGAQDEVIWLNAGGQEGDFPARQIVDMERVRAAARAFLSDRTLDPALGWRRQS